MSGDAARHVNDIGEKGWSPRACLLKIWVRVGEGGGHAS